jgi:hypothetical protein
MCDLTAESGQGLWGRLSCFAQRIPLISIQGNRHIEIYSFCKFVEGPANGWTLVKLELVPLHEKQLMVNGYQELIGNPFLSVPNRYRYRDRLYASLAHACLRFGKHVG